MKRAGLEGYAVQLRALLSRPDHQKLGHLFAEHAILVARSSGRPCLSDREKVDAILSHARTHVGAIKADTDDRAIVLGAALEAHGIAVAIVLEELGPERYRVALTIVEDGKPARIDLDRLERAERNDTEPAPLTRDLAERYSYGSQAARVTFARARAAHPEIPADGDFSAAMREALAEVKQACAHPPVETLTSVACSVCGVFKMGGHTIPKADGPRAGWIVEFLALPRDTRADVVRDLLRLLGPTVSPTACNHPESMRSHLLMPIQHDEPVPAWWCPICGVLHTDGFGDDVPIALVAGEAKS